MKTKLVILFLFIGYIAWAQSTINDFNGNTWNSLTEQGKIVFFVGMIHGELIVLNYLYEMNEEMLLKDIDNKTNDSRSIKEAIAGIDLFYSDKNNLGAPIYYAYKNTLEKNKNVQNAKR